MSLFVLGLFVGPLAVMTASVLLSRRDLASTRNIAIVIAVVLLLLLLIPALPIELRIGVFMGGLLGLLLCATPFQVREA